jgi:hypothetical protein
MTENTNNVAGNPAETGRTPGVPDRHFPEDEKNPSQRSSERIAELIEKNPKFVEFLSLHSDWDGLIDEKNIKEIEKRKETFDGLPELRKSLIGLAKKLEKESGIKFAETEVEGIEKYILEQAIDNPQEIDKLLKKSRDFSALPEEISKLEAELENEKPKDEIVKRQTELNEQREKLNNEKTPPGLKRVWHYVRAFIEQVDNKVLVAQKEEELKNPNLTNEQKQAIKQEIIKATEYQRKIKGPAAEELKALEEEFEKNSQTIKTIDGKVVSLKEKIASFQKLRSDLFEGVAPLSDLVKLISTKVAQKFENINAGTLNDLLKIQGEYGDLKEKGLGKYSAIDPLAEVNRDDFVEKLDKSFDTLLKKKISDAIVNSPTASYFKDIEKSFREYIQLAGLGSKDTENIRVFIQETLEENIDKITGTTEQEKNIKKINLQGLILKVKSKII